MSKDEMIAGLKAGRTLVQDGWAHEDEVRYVNELDKEGLITKIFQEGDQYSAYLIRWKQEPSNAQG